METHLIIQRSLATKSVDVPPGQYERQHKVIEGEDRRQQQDLNDAGLDDVVLDGLVGTECFDR